MMNTITEAMEKKLQSVGGYRDLLAIHISAAFYRAWVSLKESGNERFDFRDISDCDVERAIENLRDAGQVEFTVSDQSTDLMAVIDELISSGCTLVGFVKVNEDRIRFGKARPDLIPALLFKLPD